MKRIVIIGGTSGIAEQCARAWLNKQPVELILVGRDAMRLEIRANDLKVRSPKSVIRIILTDFMNTESINSTVSDIANCGPIDIILIAHGALPDQIECQTNLSICKNNIEINGLSPVLFAEAFANELGKADHGTLAIIGSVAGDRGRKSNYVYGAAKGLVARYAQGLQHRFAGTGVKVIIIKPGPTDTPMTAHLKEKGAKLAPVEEVANQIIEAIDAGRPIVYAPRKWSIIMMAVRHLPRSIFNKINF